MKRLISWLAFLIRDESGFLGFGGGERKREAKKTAAEAKGLRAEIGKWRERFEPMITDPTKRGFSPEVIAKMKGQAAEPIAGARTSMQRALQRSIAAQGMGGTGAYNRAIMQSEPRFTEALRSSMRDIDIAAEQASREDLWRAYGMQAGTFGEQLGTFNPQLAAQHEAYKSVWGPALAGIAQAAVGGAGSGFGYAMGRKPSDREITWSSGVTHSEWSLRKSKSLFCVHAKLPVREWRLQHCQLLNWKPNAKSHQRTARL